MKQTIFVNVLLLKDGKVLLVRRSDNERLLPGYYELPGGRVELGETLEHAAKRKLLKELGVVCEVNSYHMSLARVDQKGPYVRVFFIADMPTDAELKLADNYSEVIFVDKKSTSNKQIASDAKSAMDVYFVNNADKNTAYNKTQQYVIYTDGGSRGNPGPSAAAYLIYDQAGKRLESGGEYIGIATNNQAEYTAVLLALKAARQVLQPIDILQLRVDSLLVVNQMNGMYKIKNRELWPLHQQIRELMGYFSEVTFVHIPREQNTAADGKVNSILNKQHS